MFLDSNPKYTDTEVNYKLENPIVVERFIKKQRNISDYSHTVMITDCVNRTFSDYTYASKKHKPTPERLKRAMFKTSSRGIASALKK